MEGLTVVLAGDFRQTLPVISRSTLVDEVHLFGDAAAGNFGQQLLHLGEVRGRIGGKGPRH
ncbi:unnamed protein product [Strongylus vulgaris]|uniref:Uncharacterized protein n=1 Tax=Strongylus vulgaris TaxID=40348 RepID=A0A3P7J5H4_STRVU|nr:unnamed protein product [Strongylus vulgaris]